MSFEATAWARKARVKNSTEKLVLILLADHANEQNLCWPAIKKIANEVGSTPRTIRRAISSMEQQGLLIREQRKRDDGSQASNVYRLVMSEGVRLGQEVSGGVILSSPPDTDVLPPRTPMSALESSLEPYNNKGDVEKPTRLPDDWVPTRREIDLSEQLGFSPDAFLDCKLEFINYWKSQTGKKAMKSDWDLTFRNWLRSTRKRWGNTNWHPTQGTKGKSEFEKYMERKRG